jgi:type II secretion system (T2SS) protein M
MSTGSIDRRLLWLLAAMAILVALRYTVFAERETQVVAPAESVASAEKRLQRLREQAATVDGKEVVLKQAAADLAAREKGIIQADTAAQAQARLLDTIRRIATANGFDARGVDQFSEPRPLGSDYGVVSVTETFTCGIEQLVNFLAALSNEPEILAANDIQITGGTDKKKNIQVRLSLSGVVPRKLVPVKKAGSL